MSDDYECEPVETSGNKGQVEHIIRSYGQTKRRDLMLLRLINDTRDLEKEHNDSELTEYTKDVFRRALGALTPERKEELWEEFADHGWLDDGD